jgi:hypothetical protein
VTGSLSWLRFYFFPDVCYYTLLETTASIGMQPQINSSQAWLSSVVLTVVSSAFGLLLSRNRVLLCSLSVLLFGFLPCRGADFTDADWMSMGTLPGTDGEIQALVLDASGNLYVGGSFTVIGDVPANNIAKWNGTTWSALGGGADDYVWALAVSGNDLYAGGWFHMAGGLPAVHIARWNGTNWSPVGLGLNDAVYPLFASATTASRIFD